MPSNPSEKREETRPRITSTRYVKRWRKNHPGKRNELRRNNYAVSKKTAVRHRHDWQIWEMEAIAADDLTDRELAKKLGRTTQAIQQFRYRLNRRPRKERMRDDGTGK